MSMKRTKSRSGGAARDRETETDFWAKPAAPEASWSHDVDSKPDEAFAPYALSTRFSKGQLVHHGKFGKGVVVDADSSRVEILFQDGKKKLGHGQGA